MDMLIKFENTIDDKEFDRLRKKIKELIPKVVTDVKFEIWIG